MYRIIYIYRLDELANSDFIEDNVVLMMRDRFHASSVAQCDKRCLRLEEHLNSLSVYKYKVTQYPIDKLRKSNSDQLSIPF